MSWDRLLPEIHTLIRAELHPNDAGALARTSRSEWLQRRMNYPPETLAPLEKDCYSFGRAERHVTARGIEHAKWVRGWIPSTVRTVVYLGSQLMGVSPERRAEWAGYVVKWGARTAHIFVTHRFRYTTLPINQETTVDISSLGQFPAYDHRLAREILQIQESRAKRGQRRQK